MVSKDPLSKKIRPWQHWQDNLKKMNFMSIFSQKYGPRILVVYNYYHVVNKANACRQSYMFRKCSITKSKLNESKTTLMNNYFVFWFYHWYFSSLDFEDYFSLLRVLEFTSFTNSDKNETWYVQVFWMSDTCMSLYQK